MSRSLRDEMTAIARSDALSESETDSFRLVQSGKASYAGYLTWDDHSSIQPQVLQVLQPLASPSVPASLCPRGIRSGIGSCAGVRRTHAHAMAVLNLNYCSPKAYEAFARSWHIRRGPRSFEKVQTALSKALPCK